MLGSGSDNCLGGMSDAPVDIGQGRRRSSGMFDQYGWMTSPKQLHQLQVVLISASDGERHTTSFLLYSSWHGALLTNAPRKRLTTGTSALSALQMRNFIHGDDRPSLSDHLQCMN
jgi:hypothetical protein